MFGSGWRVFLYTLALLLAVIVGANLQQRATDAALEEVSAMGLGGNMPSMAAGRAVDGSTFPAAVRDGLRTERPWVGVVLTVEGENASINGGSDHGLAVGMFLDVVAYGKRLVDPETGLTTGSVTEKIGRLRVVDVEPHVSRAAIVEGGEDLESGARVELRP